ncbi:MAG: hypothetical protein V1774_08790 [Candidatus Eisenbacteria bacterium]
MNHSRSSEYRLRAHAKAATVLLALAFAGVPLGAGANPLPNSICQVHVQAPDPAYCDHPITSCEQVVPYTHATGILEFDVLIINAEGHTTSLQTSVSWPASWELIEYEICIPAQGDVQVQGNELLLDLAWPDCLEAWMIPVARVVLNVTENGFCTAGGGEIFVGCEPYTFQDFPLPGQAEAGAGCAHCVAPCALDPCRPSLDPASLDMETARGEILVENIHVDISGSYGMEPCTEMIFYGTESWMEVIAHWDPSYWSVELELIVDATLLEPGTYHGWVKGEDACIDCTEVLLTVFDNALSVPDERDHPDPAPGTLDWGWIKALYQVR